MDIQTDGQENGKMEIQTKRINRQIERQRDEIDRTGGWIYRWMDRQTDQIDRRVGVCIVGECI
jgi:hypothetical protein